MGEGAPTGRYRLRLVALAVTAAATGALSATVLAGAAVAATPTTVPATPTTSPGLPTTTTTSTTTTAPRTTTTTTAPGTSVPGTSAPGTSAPGTSAPGTSAPGTSPASPSAPAGATVRPSQLPAGEYQNPVSPWDAPDPTVVLSQGTYYAFTTAGLFGPIQLFTSTDLAHWSVVYPSPLVHEPAWAWPGQEWAPVVSQFGSSWIMYYSTFDIATETHCISVATASAVAGPYVDDSPGPLVCQPGYGGNLDPDVAEAGGSPYLVWSTDAGAISSLAEVWSQPLAADGESFAPGSSPKVLIHQDQVWETTIENPDMVLDNGQYFLFYSGGYWGSADYAVGYAVCAGPQGPCAKPLAHPILVSSASVSGPGGEFAFRDTTGQWWMAYAAWTAGQVGYPAGARSLRIDPLCFVTGGQGGPADPVVLGPTSTPQPLHQSCPGSDQNDGYRLVTPTGSVYPFGHATDLGSPTAVAAPIVTATTDPATDGYWELGSDGRVYPFDAPFLGDLGGVPMARPAVALVATPDGGGYWVVAADGGVFAFGDAQYRGSASTLTLNSPIVGAAATPDGGGYWLVAADGGVFAYGDARFMGSMGGRPLNAAIVGMAAMPDGTGYWLVASDGGVFAFGQAPFRGSTGGLVLNRPIVALVPAGGGGGYWLVASDGGVFAYGAAQFVGSTGGQPLGQPVVGMAVG